MTEQLEKIIGTDRTDDYRLALDDTSLQWREMIIGAHRVLWTATLVGNRAPIVAAMYERMIHPQIGDLVWEQSKFNRSEAAIHGFGILLGHRYEGGAGDEDDAVDHVWYVQYGQHANDVVRWVNCQFLTVINEKDVR